MSLDHKAILYKRSLSHTCPFKKQKLNMHDYYINLQKLADDNDHKNFEFQLQYVHLRFDLIIILYYLLQNNKPDLVKSFTRKFKSRLDFKKIINTVLIESKHYISCLHLIIEYVRVTDTFLNKYLSFTNKTRLSVVYFNKIDDIKKGIRSNIFSKTTVIKITAASLKLERKNIDMYNLVKYYCLVDQEIIRCLIVGNYLDALSTLIDHNIKFSESFITQMIEMADIKLLNSMIEHKYTDLKNPLTYNKMMEVLLKNIRMSEVKKIYNPDIPLDLDNIREILISQNEELLIMIKDILMNLEKEWLIHYMNLTTLTILVEKFKKEKFNYEDINFLIEIPLENTIGMIEFIFKNELYDKMMYKNQLLLYCIDHDNVYLFNIMRQDITTSQIKYIIDKKAWNIKKQLDHILI